MNRRACAGRLLILAITAVIAPAAGAQTSTALLERGIVSYRALEFDSAAGWLRRALTPPVADRLPPPAQVEALAYLGATERFRGRPDSAAAAFRRMLRIDPGARPDPLIFPPEVTRLFEQVRAAYPIVAVTGDSAATIDREHASYPIRLVPSTMHDVVLVLDRADGRSEDTLYSGTLGDTLVVPWNGRDGAGARVPDGRYWITAITVDRGPESCRTRLPLEIAASVLDTLPSPAPLLPSDLLPERAASGDAPAAFARAALFSAAAVGLTSLGEDGSPTGPRIVAGVLGVTGIIALIHYRTGAVLQENVAANAVRRAASQRQMESVAAANRARVSRLELHLTAGAPQILGCITT